MVPVALPQGNAKTTKQALHVQTKAAGTKLTATNQPAVKGKRKRRHATKAKLLRAIRHKVKAKLLRATKRQLREHKRRRVHKVKHLHVQVLMVELLLQAVATLVVVPVPLAGLVVRKTSPEPAAAGPVPLAEPLALMDLSWLKAPILVPVRQESLIKMPMIRPSPVEFRRRLHSKARVRVLL